VFVDLVKDHNEAILKGSAFLNNKEPLVDSPEDHFLTFLRKCISHTLFVCACLHCSKVTLSMFTKFAAYTLY
jgi:hypothetical protein